MALIRKNVRKGGSEIEVELSVKIEKEILELKKDVVELTEDNKFLKRVMGKMLNSIKSLDGAMVPEPTLLWNIRDAAKSNLVPLL